MSDIQVSRPEDVIRVRALEREVASLRAERDALRATLQEARDMLPPIWDGYHLDCPYTDCAVRIIRVLSRSTPPTEESRDE